MGRWGRSGLTGVLGMLLSACSVASGGGGGTAEDLLKPVTQESGTAEARGLGKLSLASREVDGFAVSQADGLREVQVAQDGCAPLGRALSGVVVGEPVSMEVREAVGEGAAVTIALAEYADGQAESVMDTLAVSAAECADGFTATVDGVERKFEKAAPEIAPEGADQAMGLGAVVRGDGAETPVKAMVLRKGNIVAYLSAVPDGGAAEGFSVPAVVVNAQLAKLG
ncbi:hypothetical protein ACFXAZ_12705 [Streptomyces sp. NPDC059477]|uniref:hypothetical protein n=1 Tax=Streptomyces sp. NPDC059477 TaxID=3346847 RepID=UPI0036A9CBF8